MKGFKKDKVSKKTAKKIMVALACMMATTLPFNQSVYAADPPADVEHDTTAITDKTNSDKRVVNKMETTEGDVKRGSLTVGENGEVKRATGGLTVKGNATENSVTVKEGATIGDNGAIGGNSMSGGNAERNSVTIEGGEIKGTVEGGRAVEGTADGNKVTVENGDITGSNNVAIMGGNGVKGASNNTVTISQGESKTISITGDVFGGRSTPSDPEGITLADNTVNITGGTINGTIMGAFAVNSDGEAKDSMATGNTVNITGGTINTSSTSIGTGDTAVNGIYGAFSTGDVTGGTVNIKDSTVSGDSFVVGGESSKGNVKGASVTVSGDSTTITGTLYGGKSGLAVAEGKEGGQATGNTVTISGGTITAKSTESAAVIGGFGAGLAEGNQVTIGKATISMATDKDNGSVIGGASETLASKNSVKLAADADIACYVDGGYSNEDATANSVVTAGKVGGDVRGGYAIGGNATSNTLTINGGEIKGRAAGGRTDGGQRSSGGISSASRNTLTINDGTVKAAAAGFASDKGSVTSNTLYMNDGTVGGTEDTDGVAAGYTTAGTAEGNVLYLAGGTVTSAGGASGGASGTGEAKNNTLIMTGGTVTKDAYGGFSDTGSADSNVIEISGNSTVEQDVVGGWSNGTDISTNNNTVKITGGDIKLHIFGGNIKGNSGTATGNQIFVSGDPTLNSGAHIVAGRVNNAANIDENSNNNIYLGYADRNTVAALTKAVNVNTIAGETLYLGAFSGAAVDAGEVQDGAVIKVDTVNAKTINLSKAALDRVVNEEFTLMDITNPDDIAVTGDVAMGTTLKNRAGLVDGKVKFIGPRTVQDQTAHAVLNAQAGVAALAAGNTLIERAATGLEADGFTGDNPQEWRAFAYVGGGRAEYATGSSVTTSTWNGMVGFGRHDKRKDGGSLTYGVFYEYGNGNYSTDDSAGKGDGQATYMGGGLLAKNETPKGFYYEGSLRAGRMTNDARNILRAAGKTFGYNKSSNYWGFHLGAGRVLRYNNGRSLDVYGKYFYNRLNGFSFDAAGRYDLDAVQTSLLRLGTRYNFWKQAGWTSYGGFAYEYEFGGEAGGFADGYAIPKADLGGSSAMFELGMKLQPDENSPWGVDLNLTAHAGQRKGVMGGATVSYAF